MKLHEVLRAENQRLAYELKQAEARMDALVRLLCAVIWKQTGFDAYHVADVDMSTAGYKSLHRFKMKRVDGGVDLSLVKSTKEDRKKAGYIVVPGEGDDERSEKDSGS